MKNTNYLAAWIKRFLLEYLISTRNLSKNTQQSYRDTFRLLLPFIAKQAKKPIDQLFVEDISHDRVKIFLTSLERDRNCSVSTRNVRLAALHAFAQFIGSNSPEHVAWCQQIHMIPLKKAEHALITYLDRSEMYALLDAPNVETDQGKRDYALLLFLYNTGARASEAAQLAIADLDIVHAQKKDTAAVLIKGKGNKSRRCPLWPQTVAALGSLISDREKSEHVFLNRCKQPLTRFGIYDMTKRYAKKVAKQMPSMKQKKISTHTLRHTTATHLMQSGVDINTIRVWLGHVSLNTTNIYAELDLEMKAKALASCEIAEDKHPTHWRDKKDLMSFLDTI